MPTGSEGGALISAARAVVTYNSTAYVTRTDYISVELPHSFSSQGIVVRTDMQRPLSTVPAGVLVEEIGDGGLIWINVSRGEVRCGVVRAAWTLLTELLRANRAPPFIRAHGPHRHLLSRRQRGALLSLMRGVFPVVEVSANFRMPSMSYCGRVRLTTVVCCSRHSGAARARSSGSAVKIAREIHPTQIFVECVNSKL